MATDIIKTIAQTSSPVVPDYTSLQAWEDALPANLVTADERHIGECLNQGTFTANVVISGQTTDATRYVYLRSKNGHGFNNSASVRTTALSYNTANGVSIETSGIPVEAGPNFTRIEGIQAKRTAYSVSISIGGDSARADSCICLSGINFGGGANNRMVVNSLINGGISSKGEVHGCTLIGPGSGNALTSLYNVLLVKNTAVFNFATILSGTSLRAGSDYNATDLASDAFGTGSNNVYSLVYADQFENTTNDFRAKSTGGLKSGTPDVTNLPDDISGFTRDTTAPWIGAWEVAPPPAPVSEFHQQSQPIFQKYLPVPY